MESLFYLACSIDPLRRIYFIRKQEREEDSISRPEGQSFQLFVLLMLNGHKDGKLLSVSNKLHELFQFLIW